MIASSPPVAQVTPAPTPRPAAVVHIKNFAFVPARLAVRSGETGLEAHERWETRLVAPGNYPYFCALHPMMRGTIVVRATKS